MAFRYRVRHVEAGDVADARDWNLNHAALAAEFNGHVDRDNLPEVSVDTEDIVPGAFSVVESNTIDPLSGTAAVDGQRIGWQTIQSMTIEVPSDGIIEIEWGGAWSFGAATSSAVHIAFRVVCGGAEVVLAPDFYSSVTTYGWSTLMFGEVVMGAGTHTIDIQARSWLTDSESPTSETCTVHFAELIAVWRGH